MQIRLLIVTAVCTAAALTACSSDPGSPGVPTLGGTGASASAGAAGCVTAGQQQDSDLQDYRPTCAGAAGDDRKNALHVAADCIRRHGIPSYKDPVLMPDGHVYTDARSYHEAEETTVEAAAQACAAQISAAGLVPDGQAPAPPALVQAGVKAAQCMRANGLPNYRDPTANSLFTPGHGFGVDPASMPGDKTDPTVRHALDSCRPQLNAEAAASSLGSLGG